MSTPPMLPSGEQALDMPPDSLALAILQYANGVGGRVARSMIVYPGTLRFEGTHRYEQVESAVARATSAWNILVFLRLLEPLVDGTDDDKLSGIARITKRGLEVALRDKDLVYARAANRIDSGLHPLLQQDDIAGYFGRRDYDTAIFRAMRRVEIAVRQEAGLNDDDTGVKLMTKAFNPDNGTLADDTQNKGEQKSTSDLFAGAIGVFKNPSSHREVDFDDPNAAAEIVLLADLLLRTLDNISLRIGSERIRTRQAEAEAKAAAAQVGQPSTPSTVHTRAPAPQTLSLPPVVQPRGGSGGPSAERVSHEYLVGNANDTSLTFLQLWIVDREGDTISSIAGGPMVIAPGEKIWAGVEVHQPSDDQELIVKWRDRTGEYEEKTGIHPPRHM